MIYPMNGQELHEMRAAGRRPECWAILVTDDPSVAARAENFGFYPLLIDAAAVEYDYRLLHGLDVVLILMHHGEAHANQVSAMIETQRPRSLLTQFPWSDGSEYVIEHPPATRKLIMVDGKLVNVSIDDEREAFGARG